MATIDPISIKGLKEFQAALRAMDGESQKQLRVALNEAADIVVTKAKPLIPRRTGRAAASLKAQSSQREARVKAGGARVGYVPWLEFGGRVGRNKSVKRPFIREGRYIYPAYVQKRQEIMDTLQESLVRVATNSGLKVE